ncbi:MAG: PKD domain-containing protein [Bacteroidetes bacterium]|nr:PKD domain-containing protein [Bacteroidota bacterium]
MTKTFRVLLIALFVLGFCTFGFSNITHSGNPTIVGCTDTFTTSIVGSFYQWSFGPNSNPRNFSSPTPKAIAFFLTPGSHTVRVMVTTAGGPVGDSLTFNVNASATNMTLTSFPTPVCAGTPTTFSAGSGFAAYAFFLNDSLIQLSSSSAYQGNLAAGDSVRVFGSNGGCFSNASNTIKANPLPAAATISSSIANDTICSGDLVVFSATPPGQGTYLFYNGGSQQQSSVSNTWTTTQLGQGNQVIVLVKDANGCTSGWSNVIKTTVKPTPQINSSASTTGICQGESITISVSTAQPPSPTSYDFKVNSVSVQNTASVTYTSTGFNNNDTVVITGSLDGCNSAPTPPIIISVSPIPAITITSSADSICQGSPVTFTALPAGYTTYIFSNGGTVLQSSASNTYTSSSLNDGAAITCVADNQGCSGLPSNEIVIAVSPAPIVNAGNDDGICINNPADSLTGFSPAGGAWSGTGISDPSGIFDPAVAGVGAHILSYSFTDPNNGCPASDSKTFTVNGLPQITAPSPVNICGEPAQLNASGGTTYSWSPTGSLNNPNISNPEATPTQTTDYVVTVTDNNGCKDSATVTVNVNPTPVASFTYTPVCTGMPSSFINTSTPATGNSYVWDFGDGTTSNVDNPTHTYNSGGSYTVILTAHLGTCSHIATQTVTVYSGAKASFDATPLTSYSDESSPINFNNQSTNSDSWVWDFGDGNSSTQRSPSHTYTSPGVYTIVLVAANQYGCDDTFTRINYITIYQNARVFVPNVFSPNGDGANDLFLVYALGTRYAEVSVFDRVGEKVYESNDVNEGWDGTYKGKPAPLGVYAYSVKVVFDDNTTRYLKGSVTLIK